MKQLILILLLIMGAPTVSAQNSTTETFLTDPAQEQLARAIMREIRCLQCQNQSIVDSNADLAKDLRQLIRLKVKEGMTRDQIIEYLVVRYGDWILLRPPVTTSTYLLWGSPILLFVMVGYIILQRRKQPHPVGKGKLSAEEEAQLARLLQETEAKLAAEEESGE